MSYIPSTYYIHYITLPFDSFCISLLSLLLLTTTVLLACMPCFGSLLLSPLTSTGAYARYEGAIIGPRKAQSWRRTGFRTASPGRRVNQKLLTTCNLKPVPSQWAAPSAHRFQYHTQMGTRLKRVFKIYQHNHSYQLCVYKFIYIS